MGGGINSKGHIIRDIMFTGQSYSFRPFLGHCCGAHCWDIH